MKRYAILPLLLICGMVVLSVFLSACNKVSNPDDGVGSNSDMGGGNTEDIAVTGGVIGVGMTYADLKGYVNIPPELIVQATADNLVFRVGVWYGESKGSLSHRAIGERTDRDFTVTVSDVEAGKTYYYQSYLEVGNYVYDPVEDEWIPVFQTLGRGTEIGTFITKEVKFEGGISADEARDVTFFKADISGKVEMSTLDAKETVIRGFVWSTDRKELSGQLAGLLDKAHFESTPGDKIELVTDLGYFVNDNVHFYVGEESDVRLYSEPGSILYYSPFLIISGTSFTGEPKEVTMRSLAQKEGFVDLGLSCLWSAVNIDALSPWEMGTTRKAGFTSADMDKDFGSGMRLPLQEEIEEMNRRCSFEAIDNGVLITGPNGNQIFLPSLPLEESYSASISLNTNCYLSGSNYSKTVFGQRDEYQIGYYYSSDGYLSTTDLPVLSYPYNSNQHYYLRPVQGDSGGGTGFSSGVAGIYTVYEYYWDDTWRMGEIYEVTISDDPEYSGHVFVSNFWNAGSVMDATVHDSGARISIPAGQLFYTDERYGDVMAYVYDSDTEDITNNGEILLEYDSLYDQYHSSIFVPVCNMGIYGYYYVKMKRD